MRSRYISMIGSEGLAELVATAEGIVSNLARLWPKAGSEPPQPSPEARICAAPEEALEDPPDDEPYTVADEPWEPEGSPTYQPAVEPPLEEDGESITPGVLELEPEELTITSTGPLLVLDPIQLPGAGEAAPEELVPVRLLSVPPKPELEPVSVPEPPLPQQAARPSTVATKIEAHTVARRSYGRRTQARAWSRLNPLPAGTPVIPWP